jgi:hypothetical protein
VSLYDTLADFDDRVFRNITSLRISADLFDDLVPDARGQAAAVAADLRMRPWGGGGRPRRPPK